MMSIYAQFCHTVATLLQAEFLFHRYLWFTADSIDNRRTGKKDPSGRRKTPGWRITWDVDEEDGTFPQILKEVPAIGEESGELASMLNFYG